MLQDTLTMPKLVGLGICAVGAYVFCGLFKRHCPKVGFSAYVDSIKQKMQMLRSLATASQASNQLAPQVRNVHLEVNRLRQMTQRPPFRDIAIQTDRSLHLAPRQNPAHIHWRMADQIARVGRERDAHIATINHLRLELRLAYRDLLYPLNYIG